MNISFNIFEGFEVLFTGADLDDFLYVVYKDFSIADMTGIQCFLSRLNYFIYGDVSDDDFNFHLGQHVYIQLNAAVTLTGTFQRECFAMMVTLYMPVAES